ncbi:MAG: PocR ligand-binding domain-containing protein, partial [Sphaerochaetaceae bacterium]|nr:PocR ligand-binding domain-containing protein [Sphaerochaetaceae bacterium]
NQSLHYQCHGGLTEVVIPIEIDNTLVAFAMIGQFRLKENPPENIVKSYIEQGFSAEELENAYKDRPLFTQEKLNKMINIFSTTISLMVNSGEMKIKKATLVEQVLNYVDKHIQDVITINEVSESLKKSPSSITHTLTKELGMPFKQLIITRKIMTFENIVNNTPNITIKKASSLIGFDDPLYFSRLYKKKIGITPREFVNTARQTKLSQNEIIPKLHTFAKNNKPNKF